MSVAKVTLNGDTTLMDTTGVTVNEENLMSGFTALDNTGTLIEGEATGGGGDTYTAYIIYSPEVTEYTEASFTYNNVTYKPTHTNKGTIETITFTPGETINLRLWDEDATPGYIYIEDVSVGQKSGKSKYYDYTLPEVDISIELTSGQSGQIKVYAGVSGDDGIISRKIIGVYTNENVTTIGSNAFYGCKALSEVSFPLVTTIQDGAFSYCSNLSRVSFPLVSSIGYYAFYNCQSLSEVNFSMLSIIKGYAFTYCSNMLEASFSQALSIEANAFYGCRNLSSIYTPLVSSIGGSAFYNCQSLLKADFSLVKVIATATFYQCYALSEASFPQALSIDSSAFYHCDSLTEVNFSMVSRTGTSAFAYCSNILEASFPQLSSIASYAFAYCSKLSSISFPSAGAIYTRAFAECYGLKSVYFPKVSSIASSAFTSCQYIENVYFPNCYSISAYAFGTCIRLSKAVFGNLYSSATSSIIYDWGFYGCYSLLSLYLLGSDLWRLSNINAFSYTPISTYTTSTGGVYGSIFVPASLYSSYIVSTNWTTYSSRFVSMTDAEIEALIGTLPE